MNAMIRTRPNISQRMSVVRLYMASLMKEHWKAIQWVLRYLRGIFEVCFHFQTLIRGLGHSIMAIQTMSVISIEGDHSWDTL